MNPINSTKPAQETTSASAVSLPEKTRTWNKPADLVIIYGPDTDQNMLMTMLEGAEKKCLTVKLIGDAEKSLNLAEVAACRQSGAMGPATQVLVAMHGTHTHEGHLMGYGSDDEHLSSTALMHLLRGSHPDGAMAKETGDAIWTGTVHVMSCESGKMRNEIFQDQALWRSGNYVLHASGKAVMKDSVLSNALSIIDYLGECKREHCDPDLYGLSRRLIGVTGESLTLAGAGLRAPLIVHAPRMPEHTMPDYLAHRKNTGEKNTISGDATDIDHLLRGEPARQQTHTAQRLEKALNTFKVRLLRKKFEEAENLLEHFPQLAKETKGKTAALIEASVSGHVPIVSRLVGLGADIHTQSPSGYMPLALACAYGHRDAAAFLIDAGAATDVLFDRKKMSILHLAAASNNADLMGYLAGLPKMHDMLDYQNTSDMTALHLAAKNGNTEMIRALKNNDANVALQDASGSTALHYAILSGKLEASRLLANEPALVNLEDDEGVTPLHLAAERGFLEALPLLVSAGADVWATEDAGRSVLHCAVQSGNPDAVRFCLAHAPGLVNTQDKDGNAPLHLATSTGQLPMVKILREAKANSLLKNKNGHMPVVLAGLNGHHDIVAEMLRPSTRNHKTKPGKPQS